MKQITNCRLSQQRSNSSFEKSRNRQLLAMPILKAISVATLLLVGAYAHAGNPSAVGDVVGRALNVSGLGWIGHVGMYDGNKVLEALNEPTVIQKNTVSNFKGRSSYWGAKYGTWTGLYKAIDKGANQANFSPTYTTTAIWKEGGYAQTCVKRNWYGGCIQYQMTLVKGQFRCDTFVLYSYYYGAGVYLSTIALPSVVYNAMPKTRA